VAINRKSHRTVRLKRNPRYLTRLYERDYYSWTGIQVRALRERNFSGLDCDDLAEEVEDLGKAERHRLESLLESLLMHLLKWTYQPRQRTRSWSNSIEEHRFRASLVLRKNPGLNSAFPRSSPKRKRRRDMGPGVKRDWIWMHFRKRPHGLCRMFCAPTFGQAKPSLHSGRFQAQK
jgi:Domain of unknown function DUF29